MNALPLMLGVTLFVSGWTNIVSAQICSGGRGAVSHTHFNQLQKHLNVTTTASKNGQSAKQATHHRQIFH